jgi:hypothetical protein
VQTPLDPGPYLRQLELGERFPFADWPSIARTVPREIGVYTIWDEDDQFVYVGIAYTANPSRNGGLRGRLHSHASGQRSGDRFCVYVADLFVLPQLEAAHIAAIANRHDSFDTRIRTFIRESFFFRYAVTGDPSYARQLEILIKGGALEAGKPHINPTVRTG